MGIKIRPRFSESTTCDADLSHDLPPLLARIYKSRGVSHPEDLNKSLTALPSPATLKGLDQAVTLLSTALNQQQRVLVVGDFDADGATSSALTVLALKAFGLKHIDFLVPNRFEYGYGLTPEIVALGQQRQPDLLITVDNGISSIEGVAAAKQSGIKVLVTDHHLPGESMPDADAIVNPNQPDCQFPAKNLAGVGVVFYVMSALRTQLRESGWFIAQRITEPNMATWLDLVALGTVADVVPLDKTNRILVHQGLMRIRSKQTRPGILALLTIAGRDPIRLAASDLGFVIGPRLNAAGRLDDMGIGIECLLADSPELAHSLALQLDELNRDRRVIEAGMQKEGEALVSQLNLDASGELPWGLCLYDESWHQGVVGLLASRIKEKTHRPVVAFAEENQHMLKGSARSIPGLHIRDALDAVSTKHPGLIGKFGGHAMAAGLSLPKEHFQTFSKAFDAQVKSLLKPVDLQAEILTDGELDATLINLETAYQLFNAGPWGQHFPEPIFEGDFVLLQQRIVGGKHLKMVLTCQEHSQQTIDAIAFNINTDQWPNPEIKLVKLVYKLDVNIWKEKENLQFIVDYLEPVQE